MTFEEFKNTLTNAATEEVVKAAYASYFKIKYDTSYHHDLYTEQVFFEFKADKNLKNLKALAMTDESQRRFEGEFYTPLRFAKKAIHYFTRVLGKNWYKTGKYRIWDMAAGTGNLEYHLPAEAYKYLYMSTLHADEANHLKKVFPDATCFQYDYLNDDVEYLSTQKEIPLFKPNWKLPKKLRDELANPNITWIVYINPPFATAQDAKRKKSKTGVSKTKIDLLMDKSETGHAKRELLVQFMFRIAHELPKNTYLGMFSKLYLNVNTVKRLDFTGDRL
ncbi:MAG: hypothetical protein LBB74_00120 [Chitinispirillales bacterium]|jgi:hypothetical protein|nr:hypothetical protein [Chitinispirillales bacterium]